MTTYAAQGPGLTEVDVTFHTAASGDKFTNDGKTMLIVKNADDDTATICTVDDPNTAAPDGYTAFNPDVPIACNFGHTVVAGPFPKGRFNDVDGNVALSWSATTGVTWAAISTNLIEV